MLFDKKKFYIEYHESDKILYKSMDGSFGTHITFRKGQFTYILSANSNREKKNVSPSLIAEPQSNYRANKWLADYTEKCFHLRESVLISAADRLGNKHP